MSNSSIRYGGGSRDLRARFLKLCGFLQGKDVHIVNSDPRLCSEILNSSDTKGTFVEHLIATPAWEPIISTESVDGDLWKSLADKFKVIIGRTRWRERINPISEKYIHQLKVRLEKDSTKLVNAEEISKITLRILYELLFENAISKEDEDLFYSSSLEWRKEIGMKGGANPKIKKAFWNRLSEVLSQSQFCDLTQSELDPEFWLSAFAQPFLISPQINVSDIMVAVFEFLRVDPNTLKTAQQWASDNDRARLNGILLESIRLKHPFPILERELRKGARIGGRTLQSTTQFFLLFDQFQQDQEFKPERWLQSHSENLYHSIPFGTGPRMCIGKPIAMEILTDLLRAFLSEYPIDKIQPQLGHLYSGRNNDRSSGLRESVYQLKTITKALGRSWLMGRKRKKLGESSGCPWPHHKA